MLLLFYLKNQYSIATIWLCIHDQVWKQIHRINMCMYLVFERKNKFHENNEKFECRPANFSTRDRLNKVHCNYTEDTFESADVPSSLPKVGF